MVVAMYRNDSGRKTYLHENNGEWSAFVGKLGGDLRHWKTLKAAEKTLETRGWKIIGGLRYENSKVE